MAKPKVNTTVTRLVKSKVKRKGVHAKSKSSNLKSSKNYTKKHKSQGKR